MALRDRRGGSSILRPTTTSGSELRGRRAECEWLDQLLTKARAGTSGALVIRGEPGVGKSALLDYAQGQASGFRSARAAGVESEMELAFAGLHQICAPFLDRLDHLPTPQREALGTAFGLHAGTAPVPFLVGLAVLSLLSEAAETHPLVCLVDDAHWLDRASVRVLGFVARRLAEESVVLVFAVREPDDIPDLAGVPELTVGPLREPDALAILSSAISGRFDDSVRNRIVAEARGNPLALLELPRAWTPAAFAGGFGLPDSMSVSARIEESYRRQLAPLPEQSRQLLLLAAAEPAGDPILVAAAADHLGIPMEASGPGIAAGLIDIGARVGFRHPLVRSVVYRGASVEDRRRVHGALAKAMEPSRDPDRRAWHLAAAAAGPDEEVALELERSAARAQARGGFSAAAAFLQCAVALTQDPTSRGARALDAAQTSLEAGEFDAALGLLDMAEGSALGEFPRARVELLRAHLAFFAFRGGDAPALLLKAARRLEPFDMELARDTYLTACGAAIVAGHGASEGVLMEICRAVRALPPPPHAPRPLDLLLDGLALLLAEGHAAATPTLQRAAKALADLPTNDVRLWGWIAPSASAVLWDVEGMHAISAREVRQLRDVGALGALPSSLPTLAMATAWMGDFAGAAALIAEADSVTAATGSRQGPYARLRLLALQGREAAAATAIASAMELAASGGQGMAATWAQWAAAVLYNGLARYEEAALAARLAASDRLNWWSMWALPELVEAAARIGDKELALDALERLAETTSSCSTDFALGVEARCRALLSGGAIADALYGEAIERLSRTQLRPELGRAQLLYGEWLRREGRRIDAREQLRTAYDLFDTIGMEGFGERARRELLATGETVRKRTVETLDDLTPQELQIARLASDGRTNPEIAAELFLSPRTVEWHLRKVFAKLGVASRRELRSALPQSGPMTVAV